MNNFNYQDEIDKISEELDNMYSADNRELFEMYKRIVRTHIRLLNKSLSETFFKDTKKKM